MTRKQRRLVLIGSSLVVLAVAAALVLTALRDSIVFFNSPTDVVEKKVQAGTRIRLGGLVQPGTVIRKDVDASFDITDGKNVGLRIKPYYLNVFTCCFEPVVIRLVFLIPYYHLSITVNTGKVFPVE